MRLKTFLHFGANQICASVPIALLLLYLPSGGAAIGANDARPNILLIVGDDMGYADIGIHGCTDIPTPNIDSIAADGVRCTNGYVSGPYCSPTRAGLLSGRYQTRFGHEFNPGGKGKAKQRGLPLSEKTLADRLRAAGYATGLVGKWHLGTAPQFHPQRRGFDEFFGFLGGAHSYWPGEGAPIYRDTTPVDEQEYLTDALAREAVDFIERHRQEPFFLYLAFNAVHTPLDTTDAKLKEFAAIDNPKRRKYAAMMSSMDDAIGMVLAKLRDSQLDQNTLVFFISDNGGPIMRGVTINGANNAPLRGSKRTTLEGGIRVPFLVKWPGRLPAGQVYDEPVIQLDIVPTALAAAAIEADPSWQLDGVDLAPYFTGNDSAAPHDALYWRLGKQMAIRQGEWKLVRYDPAVDRHDPDVDASGGEGGAATEARLYNLARDIGEQHDLAADEPERAAALQEAWDNWNESNAAPLWGAPEKAKPRRKTARSRANR